MHIKALLAYKATIPQFFCCPYLKAASFIYKNKIDLHQGLVFPSGYRALAYQTVDMRDKAMISQISNASRNCYS